MNYGGDAADQIVRYSMEGMEHTLRISGSIAKNLAVLIVAVMKDQKKTRGKTNLLRMLKEQRAMKFFTIPHDRLREFAGEAKSRGLLYVVIRDKKNPQFPEIMVFADDAAKVNRVLDKMNLDFVKSEAGEAVVEQAPVREGERVIDAEFTEKTEAKEELPAKTEKVVLPEGTIEFELDEEEHLFDVGEVSPSLRCFPDDSCICSCSFACFNLSSISFDWISICWLKRIFFRSSFNSPLIS